MHEVEIWIAIDADGNRVVTTDKDLLGDQWEHDVGGTMEGTRLIKVTLQVQLPKPLEITATVPDGTTSATMTVNG